MFNAYVLVTALISACINVNLTIYGASTMPTTMPLPTPNLPPPLFLSTPDHRTFLQYILQHTASPVQLIICSSREAFLGHLLDGLNGHLPAPSTAPSSDQPQPEYNLFKATIGLLARSSSVRLAFCPTVQHLRAYLSAYRAPAAWDCSGDGSLTEECPLLGIVALVGLHRGTAELSAQGVGRTLAVAVEAAAREGTRLVVAEVEADARGEGPLPEMSRGVWEERIPLLNGLRGGDAVEDGRAGGLMASVKTVVGRWGIVQEPEVDGCSASL